MADGVNATRQTVILAAGQGSRLLPGHPGTPKPLVPVGGRPLIEHALWQAEAAGCTEAIVIIGSRAEELRAHLASVETTLRLQLVHNPDFSLPNGISLLAAEPYTAERFFVQMADHVFSAPVLRQLEAEDPALDGLPRLLVDCAPEGIDVEDATKVRIAGHRITAIGKQINPWDAFDTGCFRLDHRIFGALREAAAEAPPTLSAGMTRLAMAGLLVPVALEGVRWADVDTSGDRNRAETLQQALDHAKG